MGKKIQYDVCDVCKHKNNITEKLKISDFDKSWREGYALIFCDECGSQFEVKIR